MFAMGFAAIFAYAFSLYPIAVTLVALFGGVAGILPDIDLRIGVKHRSWKGTHGPIFFVFISTLFTFVIIALLYIIHLSFPNLIGLTFDDSGNIDFSESAIDILVIWFSLFLAMISHLAIDVITHSGIDFGPHHVEGSMISASPIGNFVFASIGVVMAIISISASIFSTYLNIMSKKTFEIVLLSLVGVSVLIIVAAIIGRKRQKIPDLYCGKVRGVTMCLVDKNCIDIGGSKTCFGSDGKK